MEPKFRFRDEHGKNYSGWTTQKMSELGSFFRGRILSRADLSESGTPCILYGELYTTYDEITTDIVRKTNRSLDGIYVTTGGEVIVPCSGETPEDISTATCVVPAGVALGSDLIIFKGNGAVLGPVMSYMINHKQKWNIAKKAQGKSVVHITTDTLKNLNITFPSLTEQQKIADFLSTYDKKIQLQRGRVESLERRKKGLLQKVFSQEIRFKADDGSMYPEWSIGRIGDYGTISMCRRIFKDQTSDFGDIPFFKIGTFGANADAFITRELFDDYRTKYPFPKKGNILISAAGTIGRTVEYDGKDAYFQDSNIIWINHDERIIDSYLKHYLSNHKWNNLEGGTVKRLYNNIVLQTEIFVPCIEEQY